MDDFIVNKMDALSMVLWFAISGILTILVAVEANARSKSKSQISTSISGLCKAQVLSFLLVALLVAEFYVDNFVLRNEKPAIFLELSLFLCSLLNIVANFLNIIKLKEKRRTIIKDDIIFS